MPTERPSRIQNMRVNVIKWGIIFMISLIGIRILYLEVVTERYRAMAFDNAIFKKTIYPDRGIIFDITNKPLLENITTFDLVITPSLLKNIDTGYLCKILNLPIDEFRKRLQTLIIRNGAYKPSIFETILDNKVVARLEENLFKFDGVSLQARTMRSYPYRVGAGFLGYLGEVDSSILKRQNEYKLGDYIGLSGLESFYETTLRGEKGYEYLMRDNRSRIIGPYRNGSLDRSPIVGKNIYTYISLAVQELSEKLLNNKIGSIVAIDPNTGGILAMASSPIYDPNLLTGKKRTANFAYLSKEKSSPLLNRCIKGLYAPGSTFKPIEALIGLEEGVITPNTGQNCRGAYTYCGKLFQCTHNRPGHATNLELALVNSCNSYFIHLFRLIIDNNKYSNVKIGLSKWKEYLNSFGVGVKTHVDITHENSGYIPDSNRYNRIFGPKWNSCNIASLGIGQGELQMTPLQLANLTCIIANRGFYYAPHFVKSIENPSVKERLALDNLQRKKEVLNIPNNFYEYVINAMFETVEHGTGYRAKIPGITLCGKTGTVENKRFINGKVVKMPNHSLFIAFAPKDKPKIVVAVAIENSGGFGATWAAPISSLIIEKYLNDSISDKRKQEIERIANTNLMPSFLNTK